MVVLWEHCPYACGGSWWYHGGGHDKIVNADKFKNDAISDAAVSCRRDNNRKVKLCEHENLTGRCCERGAGRWGRGEADQVWGGGCPDDNTVSSWWVPAGCVVQTFEGRIDEVTSNYWTHVLWAEGGDGKTHNCGST